MLITRRVRGRRFLLRPSPRTNQIVAYVLAVMVEKWRMRLHAVCAPSNHWHLCLTDPFGHVVEFQRDCHHFVARALNAEHGEFENLWATEPTSRVACEEPTDLIDKIAYTMANPVAAGLVRHGRSWPGLRRAWPCKPLRVARPPRFFRGESEGGSWPDVAVLELVRPPGYDGLSDQELAGLLRRAIEERESRHRAEHDAERRPFLGRHGVLGQPRHGRPRTREPRFGISPKVACRNKWLRIERLRANQLWLADYFAAMTRWRSGDRRVVFPAGTYLMRVVHRARCADGPG
jgi:hypothetical protein